MKTTNSTTGCC